MLRKRWVIVGLGLWLLGSVWFVALDRARPIPADGQQPPKFDFHHFYLDGLYAWRHAELNPNLDGPVALERRQLPFYLPIVSLVIAPIMGSGPWPAALIWTLGHALALLITLGLLARQLRERAPDDPTGRWIAALVLACALAAPAIYEASKFNQLSFFVLALVVAAVDSLARGREVRGAALLACATLLKLLPGVFVVWLALRRQWKALGAFVAFSLGLGLLPCLAVFGPQATLEYHRQWAEFNFKGPASRGMVDQDLAEHFIDRRNQSIQAVISRMSWPEHRFRAVWQPWQLSESAGLALARGIATLLLLGLALATNRRPLARAGSLDPGLFAEACAYMLAMMIFSPLLRQYYLVWCLPALTELSRAALGDAPGGARRWARAGLTAWALGMAGWLSERAREYGVQLVMLIVMAATLLIVARAARAAALGPAGAPRK